ncbi:76_t:CDS:10 [Paraglomus occultum]|uniref:76_t:CDS:1 n=1 Tax=Paraglomus occultum TaxID=144539 RepID=A0A9N8ZBK6_9GLOM|nr:76_t:CDS:10 [Paraglomus occultum]
MEGAQESPQVDQQSDSKENVTQQQPEQSPEVITHKDQQQSQQERTQKQKPQQKQDLQQQYYYQRHQHQQHQQPSRTQPEKSIPLSSQSPVGPIRASLPPGWTEHRAPNGLFYYYNAATGQSTWERPITVFPPPPPILGGPPMGPPPMGLLPPGFNLSPFQSMSSVMPIPVQQSHLPPVQGFVQPANQQAYVRKDKKKEKKKEKARGKNVSIRQIPGTSWYIVSTTEGNEFFYNSDTKQSVWEPPEEIKEPLKIFKEQERLAEEADKKISESANAKRKVDDNGDRSGEETNKRHRSSDEEGFEGTELTEDDIAFQLQFAEDQEQEQLSMLNEGVYIQNVGSGSTSANNENTANIQKSDNQQNLREAELTNEERSILFKSLLRDMNVSPFAVWEKELPRIIHDPRYILIATLKQRKELFDEYCKERVVELREEKKNKAKNQPPKEEYELLLKEEVTHRSHWDEFKWKFKRDPRFKIFSDDKARERMFRDYVKELKARESERRRAQQKKAEEKFVELLRETREIKSDSSWRKIKRLIDEDPRYDAIDSSKEASLREREAKVRKEMRRRNRDKEYAMKNAMREEAVRAFQTLLIDLVRTHEARWEDKRPDLERDSRFHSEALSLDDKLKLYDEHISELKLKRLKQFHELLDKHVKLDTTWIELLPIVKDDPRAVRLSKNESVLEEYFDAYLEAKVKKAKEESEELLKGK